MNTDSYPRSSASIRGELTASFALRDAFLREKLPEELFCRLARVSFHTVQSTFYSLDSFHPILRRRGRLITFIVLDHELGLPINY